MQEVTKRFRPLMIADFFAGLMFFYPVTFPLMHSLHFSTVQMTAYAASFNIAMLIVEVPSGIVADRWSRKRIISIGLVMMMASILIYGQAHTLLGFIIGTATMSVYFAMRSGIQEAMIYDALLELKKREEYEHQLGRLRLFAAAGYVISSLAGALIAAYISFRLPYYLSLVSCLFALYFLNQFAEPQLHRKLEATKVRQHVSILFRAISQHKEMRLLVAISILLGVEVTYMQEVDPLWPIALGLATAWYGPLNALLLSGLGVASPLAKRVAVSSRKTHLVALALLSATAGLLIRNIFIIGISEFALLATASTLTVVLSGRIQDQLPSSQRSGAESVISTLGTLAFLVSLVVFTMIANHHTVFVSAWLLVLIAVVIGLLTSLSLRMAKHVHLSSSMPMPHQ